MPEQKNSPSPSEWNQPVHAHPIVIFQYLLRFLFLLILPVIRGFLSALQGGLIAWVQGAWLDLLILFGIFWLSYQKWNHFKYYMDSSVLYYTSGIFFQHQAAIPLHRITSFSIYSPFWLKPFRVVLLRIDTIARSPENADLEFYLTAQDAQRLMARRKRPPLHGKRGVTAEYRPGLWKIVWFSLFTSNSFLGILLIATSISQAGKLLGEQLTHQLFSTFEELSRQLARGIPPILAGIAIALLVGWAVTFLRQLLRAKNLCTQRTATTLQLDSGVLTHRQSSLRIADISFVDLRQSLFTRLLGYHSVFVNGVGLGKVEADLPVIIPFSRYRNTLKKLALLLPEYQPTPRQLKPNPGAVMKFIILPLWPCLLIPLATAAACWLLPTWTIVFRFAGLMACLPAYWFLGVRLLDFVSSGLSKEGNYYTLRYSKRFYLHSVVIPADKVVLINLRQSILQRRDQKCDLLVSTRSERRYIHHLRNLGWQETSALFGTLDDWTPADAGIPNWYERIFLAVKRR